MNEGQWQAVLFGGADSLISIDACQKLNDEERLNSVGKTEGLVPGEGAAFVVLQSEESAKTNITPALGYLRGLGIAVEPNARKADLAATEGLSSAIGQAITQAGIAAHDIQGIVHNLGAETVQAIEWYQTNKKIWPRCVDEQQRVALQLGEIERADTPDDPTPQIILPCMTMGEVGAAALPMQLATALAWMDYDKQQARWGFPVRKNLLICDTPDMPERGALIISTTLAATT
jgi:3-oxoacyl-[acyl-carrier-protein] synthase-1